MAFNSISFEISISNWNIPRQLTFISLNCLHANEFQWSYLATGSEYSWLWILFRMENMDLDIVSARFFFFQFVFIYSLDSNANAIFARALEKKNSFLTRIALWVIYFRILHIISVLDANRTCPLVEWSKKSAFFKGNLFVHYFNCRIELIFEIGIREFPNGSPLFFSFFN